MEILKFFGVMAFAGAIWFAISEYSNLPASTIIGAVGAMVVAGLGFYYKLFDVKKM